MSLPIMGKLDYVTFQSLFQPKLFYDSTQFSLEKHPDWTLMWGEGPLMPLSLADKKTNPLDSCCTCSCFTLYLQKLLSRPSNILIHLQAAVQKVLEHSRQLLGILQLRYPSFSYEIQGLEEKEAQDSTCFFHNSSHKPYFLSSSLQWHFIPRQRVRDDFSAPAKRPHKIAATAIRTCKWSCLDS